MMKIVVLDAYAVTASDLSFDSFSALAELRSYERTEYSEIVERVGDAQIALSCKCPFDETILSACKNLKYIGLAGTGYNLVNIDAAKRFGVGVTNVPGYSTDAVAQHTFAFLLDAFNKVRLHHDFVEAGKWIGCKDFCFYDFGLHELNGKTIGLVGFGDIAKKVCNIATAFSMQVIVHTRTVSKELRAAFPSVSFVDLDTLLEKSDVISIHCPLSDQTRGMFSVKEFAKMQPHSILLNTARGPIVDEHALADALNSSRIAAAYTDVLSKEPPTADNPLLTAKNMVITPHIAWTPQETRKRLLEEMHRNIASFLSGGTRNRIV